MSGRFSAGPCLAVVAVSLGLAGCVETTALDEGLYYRAPTSSGQEFVATGKDAAEVAGILRAAGLGDVRTRAGEVTLTSRDVRLIDCGTFVQIAMGNRAEFPANAQNSVLMEGFVTDDLIQRGLDSRSTVRLTRAADGSGYAVSEAHSVTRRYQAVSTGSRSSTTVTFDAVSDGAFPNKTSCRSSGLVASLLR